MSNNKQTGMSPQQAMVEAEKSLHQGNLAGAENIFWKILAAQPNYAPAYHSLGLLAFQVNKLPLAADLITKAIEIDPHEFIFHRNIGELYRRLGRLPEAVAAGERAVNLAPNDLDSHYNLGLALTDSQKFQQAIKSYGQALKLNPDHNLSWNNLGSALEQTGNKIEAQNAYAKAVTIDKNHAEAQNNLGAIYSEQGKLDKARECFVAAIASRPDFVEAHYNLSSLKDYTQEDPHLVNLESLVGNYAALSMKEEIRYYFALGKAREDIKDYQGAFAAYKKGNNLQHTMSPDNEAKALETANQIKELFTREFFDKFDNFKQNNQDKTPLFIVGMPRSGTSLIEQILASHPEVYGAGELSDLNEVIQNKISIEDEELFTIMAKNLSEDEFQQMGQEYLRRVWQLAPNAAVITDKMPANFFYIGMIHLMLPGAKIIHSMRNPMDSCFSCFSRLFNKSMEFTYDLGALGQYYIRYIQLMEHWHRELPKGSILNVRYEDMVTDTEGQVRRLLDYVGLGFDKCCLEFYKNKRHVKTASVVQVRKPIYQSSVARWKRFGANLDPLLEMLGDLVEK